MYTISTSHQRLDYLGTSLEFGVKDISRTLTFFKFIIF